MTVNDSDLILKMRCMADTVSWDSMYTHLSFPDQGSHYKLGSIRKYWSQFKQRQ